MHWLSQDNSRPPGSRQLDVLGPDLLYTSSRCHGIAIALSRVVHINGFLFASTSPSRLLVNDSQARSIQIPGDERASGRFWMSTVEARNSNLLEHGAATPEQPRPGCHESGADPNSGDLLASNVCHAGREKKAPTSHYICTLTLSIPICHCFTLHILLTRI